ncbi:radical SAM protein [Candidatus Bipolaricaulota bacterium]|nr:radical SAM protein [Candidatus Bipolaricaulota bacterium]TFH09602.1 MAG: radical SAM protein [Candidatus Atribacteria bacterium]
MPSTRHPYQPRRVPEPDAQHPLVFDLVHGSTEDGPGLRTVVFLKGCPLRCAWCHNPESQRPEAQVFVTPGPGSMQIFEPIGEAMSSERVAAEIARDLPFYQASGGGVTFSGGEPMMYMPFMHAIGEQIRAQGIHVAVDTSGYFDYAEYVQLLQGTVDLFLYDLKIMDDDRHRAATGVGNARILENLVQLKQSGVDIQVRVPLIPEYTATEENLSAIASFVRENDLSKVSLLPYNPSGNDKWLKMGAHPPVLMPARPMDLSEYERWGAFFNSCF